MSPNLQVDYHIKTNISILSTQLAMPLVQLFPIWSRLFPYIGDSIPRIKSVCFRGKTNLNIVLCSIISKFGLTAIIDIAIFAYERLKKKPSFRE